MIPMNDFVIRHQDFMERTTSLMDCHQDEEDYVSCKECGALFDKVNNLAKHLQTDHMAKDAAVSGESANGAEMDAESVGEENLEQLAFANFYDKATETVQKSAEWVEKHKEHVARGIAEDEAIDSVDLELQGRIDKEALSLYKIYLENTLLLQNGSVHADVQDDLLRFWDNGFTASRAAKMAANKHSDIIQGLMEPESDSDEDSDSNSSEDV